MGTRKPQLGAIDVGSDEPVYQQLARVLRQQILSGQLPPGARLSERGIAEKHQVARPTVRSMLYLLGAQGLVRRVPRKGMVVADVKSSATPFSTVPTILVREGSQWRPKEDDPQHWYARIYAGIQAMARDMGYDLRTDIVANQRVPLNSYVPPQPSEASGAILYGIYDERYIDMFRSEHVPLVVADSWTQDLATDCVAVDVEAEARQVVDLLVQRGHTSLGFLGLGRMADRIKLHQYDPDIHRFLENLRRGMQRHRLELRDEWVLLAPNTGAMESALSNYLSMDSRPAALLCFQDAVTAAVLKTLADLSLRCPEDISIVNRGSEQVAGRLMTSLVADPELMGRTAVRLLAERMHGLRTHPVKLALPSRLVVGDSTGPAPRGR